MTSDADEVSVQLTESNKGVAVVWIVGNREAGHEWGQKT